MDGLPPRWNDLLRASAAHPAVLGKVQLPASDRVAPGRCRPRAPTDPYVRTLAHTVPQIMVSLRS